MPTPARETFLQTVFTPSILRSAAKVAFVVGIVLNAINQGPALWQGAEVSWWHVLLNFAVPFCVSSYSAAKNQMGSVEPTDT
jgi:hypothetical protein